MASQESVDACGHKTQIYVDIELSVVLLTVGTEYLVACAATQDAIWLKLPLHELDLKRDKAIVD